MATTKNITMKQFNGTDYDTLYPKTVYNQVSGVAPAGYGLGEISPYIAKTSESGEYDADTIDKTGFFAAKTNTPTGNWCYGLHVNRNASKAFQLLTSEFSEKEFALRKKISGVWQPWEWVNPPMQLGVEYRTTEQYQGKPVYVKLVDLGSCPSSGIKDVTVLGDTEVGFRCEGKWTYGGGSTLPFESNSSDRMAIAIIGKNVRIFTGGKDFSTYTAKATIYYTKTTD